MSTILLCASAASAETLNLTMSRVYAVETLNGHKSCRPHVDDLTSIIKKVSKTYRVIQGEILSDKGEAVGRINDDQTFIIERHRPANAFTRWLVGSNYGGLTVIEQGRLGNHVGVQSITLLDVEGQSICGIEIRRHIRASVSE